jgi:hypothetical protein
MGLISLALGLLLLFSKQVYIKLSSRVYLGGGISETDKRRMLQYRPRDRYSISIILIYLGAGAIAWLFGYNLLEKPFGWIFD